MQYGICLLSITPVRAEPNDRAELVTQLIYGDCFKVLEQKKNWLHVCIAFDNYTGWIDVKQSQEIGEDDWKQLNLSPFYCSNDLIEFVTSAEHQLIPICLGSHLSGLKLINHVFDGEYSNPAFFDKNKVAKTAALYLNAPYLWGGKTPFGIDCSGFTQMVYRICGYALQRDASQQAKQGEVLSFLEESEIGDLAFFDNEEGKIIHVGIILNDNQIIHAHGKVRIDLIDHTGIFNVATKTYSHQLRVIKTYK